ncbi:LCP family protein [Oceanobacillus alkalisoli]|uniref:LCP family protein n=1 Tax=Oceanobacillus alkalisoli TaxID=2925113 RepID=UPI001EF06D63|nr:LCP family protein [Oceanobacillus alkalisoli]MCF3942670.1 LCP family protein [Oceanobacillus alkalisoli]MCG5102642.1 LCP family protein [Oceanobacillus alkalisoli]
MGKRVVRRKRKKVRRLRVFLFIVLLLFLGVVGFGGYLAVQTMQAASESYDDLGREKSELREEAVSISNDPVSVLLMGIEDYQSDGDLGRTDTLMVATFNPNDEKLKLVSIPRDTMVEIAGRGYEDKINHAHAFGGKTMTIDTVENFLGIPIDYYATVNFDAFKNIIDILGGITVDVPFDFQQNSDDRKAEKLQFYEGEMRLDGRYALAYARMRYEDPRGDIGRNERQQEVISAIIDKAVSVGTITKVDDLVQEIGRNVETNLKVSEGLGFAKQYAGFNTNKIEKLNVETYPTMINGVSYQIADEESLYAVQMELKEHLEIATNEYEQPYEQQEEQEQDSYNNSYEQVSGYE